MPTAEEVLAGIRAAREPAPEKPRRRKSQIFRASIAWRRTRYAVLAASAARHGGVARCELCGAGAAPGAPLHVDHIEAVSKNWARRLDQTNLQVLCPDCNVGKLDGPAADFRAPPTVP